MHGEMRGPIAAPHGKMATAAAMGFKLAALFGEQPFEFLRIHQVSY